MPCAHPPSAPDLLQGFIPASEGGVADATAPLRLNVQPPAWDDFSSGEDSDQEDDERPLTREELKRKTLRGGGQASGGGGGGGGGGGCASANKSKDGKVGERGILLLNKTNLGTYAFEQREILFDPCDWPFWCNGCGICDTGNANYTLLYLETMVGVHAHTAHITKQA